MNADVGARGRVTLTKEVREGFTTDTTCELGLEYIYQFIQ